MIAIRNKSSAPSFVLASIVSAYPDQGYAENISALLEDEKLSTSLGESALKSFKELRAKLADVINNEQLLDDVRSDFIDRFDRGKEVTSLYETEYGRERAMVKGNELADIAGFYKAFGFATGGDGVQAEMVDHIAVELEFYALLIFKNEALTETNDVEGSEIVLDARRKFLRDHLGRYIAALSNRPGVLSSPFYSSALQFCRELVLDECSKLGVELEQIEWLSGQTQTAEITCGGSVGCLK